MDIEKVRFKRKVKGLLYYFMFYSRVLHLLIMLCNRSKKKHNAAVLVYHRIVEEESTDFLYKSPSVHHDIKDFKREMSFISKCFKIVSMDELGEDLKKGRDFESPSIAITFDDGYRDNYRLAYPILREYGLAATIYLITSLIGTNKRTWPDEIEYALLNSSLKSFTFAPLFGEEIIEISALEGRREANVRIAEALKRVCNKERLELLDRLYDILKPNGNTEKNLERRMLNWQEIGEMSNDNITFAAHTVSHPILTQVSLEDAKWEIRSLKDRIEEKTGKKIRHFAFPNGMAEDFTEELKTFCKEVGFETIATAEYGILDSRSDPFFMRRIMPDTPIHFFAGELAKVFFCPRRYKKGSGVYGRKEG